jgi:hypothetical protein
MIKIQQGVGHVGHCSTSIKSTNKNKNVNSLEAKYVTKLARKVGAELDGKP